MKTCTTDRWRYRRVPNSKYRHEEDVCLYALTAAIVRQAVDDWRDADKMMKGMIRFSNTGITSPYTTKAEIEHFLRSQWYGILCDIDPDRILKKLKEEDNERDRVR